MDYKKEYKQMLNLNFKKEYGKMLKLINERYEGEDLPEGAKEAMAFLGVGALISKIFVFWENEQDSMDEVLCHLDSIEKAIMSNITKETVKDKIEDIDYEYEYANKAYSYFVAWYKDNIDSFIDNNQCFCSDKKINQFYGIVSSETIFVFQNVFKRIMKKGGFDYQKVKKEWKKAGILDCEPGRYTKQKRYKRVKKNMFAVKVAEKVSNTAEKRDNVINV